MRNLISQSMIRFALASLAGLCMLAPAYSQTKPIERLVQIDMVLDSTSEHTRFVKTILPDGSMKGQLTEGKRPPAPMRKPVQLTTEEINGMLEKLASWEKSGDLLRLCPPSANQPDSLSVTIQSRERSSLAFTCAEKGTKGNRKLEDLLTELMSWVIVGF